MAFIRSRESAISPSAWQPSTSPVRPPQGTTGVPAALAARSTAETSSVERGRTMASGLPSRVQGL